MRAHIKINAILKSEKVHQEGMQIQLDEQLKTRIAGVTFGTVTIHGVTVCEGDASLWELVEILSKRLAREFSLDRLSHN